MRAVKTLVLFSVPFLMAAKSALPVPLTVRVDSSVARVGLWNGLTAKERNLAFRLQRAARWGRVVLFTQSHRHSLALKDVFSWALDQEQTAETKKIFAANKNAFEEFVAYVAKFQDLNGPYSSANRKYVMTRASAQQIKALFHAYTESSVTRRLDSVKIQEMTRLLTDPSYEVLRQPEDPDGADLETCGGNLYEKGITGAQVKGALAAGLKIDLGCRVIRDRKGPGGLSCEKQTAHTKGPVGRALLRVVAELHRAQAYALNDHQKRQIESTIDFLNSGNVEDFRQASIHWVRGRDNAKVDFIMGFIEVYADYQGRMGSWESYLQIIDPKTTIVARKLAQSAQYFEDRMPYGKYKKKFPAESAPPAMMVYYLQEIAEMRSGGYNLPNFDDIRRDIGFKNIIRLDLPGEDKSPATRRVYEQAFSEFMPKAKVVRALKWRERAKRVLTLLHEIIGHGSGTYDTTKYAEKEDPISALGEAGGSALEEERADLTALVFAADKKLIEVGIYESEAEALEARDAMYDTYVVYFLMRLSRDRTLSEAHARGHWLLISRLLASGAVAWSSTDEKQQTLQVLDYNLFHTECTKLLAELQRIKAERDVGALKRLLTEQSPLSAIDEPWARSVVRRGEKLLYNAGSVEQPWSITEGEGSRGLHLTPLGGESLISIAPYWLQ